MKESLKLFAKNVRKERRAGRRLKVKLPLKYRIISGANKKKISRQLHASTQNIGLDGANLILDLVSCDGLHISMDSRLYYKNMLKLEVNLPDISYPINILSEVRWYNKLGEEMKEGEYIVGVHFLHINEDDEKKLSQFIKNERYGFISKFNIRNWFKKIKK